MSNNKSIELASTNMRDQRSLEEMAENYLLEYDNEDKPKNIARNAYHSGFHAGQAALLEQASKNFEEAWEKHGTGSKPTGYEVKLWAEATLAAEKRKMDIPRAVKDAQAVTRQFCNKYLDIQKEREEMLKSIDDMKKDLEWALGLLSYGAGMSDTKILNREKQIRDKWGLK
jgi:hypothetical protein